MKKNPIATLHSLRFAHGVLVNIHSGVKIVIVCRDGRPEGFRHLWLNCSNTTLSSDNSLHSGVSNHFSMAVIWLMSSL
jgi:5-keto 4-deoxyuronate isomerase